MSPVNPRTGKRYPRWRKKPSSDADRAALAAADQKRAVKNAKRLALRNMSELGGSNNV
jgi:hypothetical protein